VPGKNVVHISAVPSQLYETDGYPNIHIKIGIFKNDLLNPSKRGHCGDALRNGNIILFQILKYILNGNGNRIMEEIGTQFALTSMTRHFLPSVKRFI
jgi:hypothetical protein